LCFRGFISIPLVHLASGTDRSVISVQTRTPGFTLVELVITILIVGILAVAGLPRLFSIQAFDNRGFLDEVVAALRYAQKAAIASRRNVCVTFSANSLALTVASGAGSTAPCDTPLKSPMGDASFQIPRTGRKPTGAVFQFVYPAFHFDALGRPRSAPDNAVARQVILIAGVVQAIKIESETGYVYAD
jgi:MSHA pilin protein MshC